MSKFKLPIAELKPAIVGLGKIIGSKSSTLPVLRMVRLDRTKDGWVTLTGTDLDAFVTVRMEEPTQGDPASVLVPFDDLAKTTKSCSAGESIEIEPGEKDTVLMRYPVGQQFAEKSLESLPIDEYPPIPKIKEQPVALDANIRTAMLEAMECASVDETRYILRGAFIDVSDKKCHAVVGTDGRHLYTSNSFSLALSDSIIIPTNKFLGWKEFNNDGEWQIRVESGKKDESGHFQISSRRWRFIHKQLDGNYPNWRQVIPKDSNTTVQMSDEAVVAIENLIPRLPLNPKHINKPMGLKVERNKLMLLGRSSDDDKWTEVEVAGVNTTGNPVTICLNRDFMLKALKFGLNELHLIDELSPMRFVSGGKQMIVMPVRPDPGPAVTTEVAVKTPEPSPEPQPESKTSTERNTMPTPSTNGPAPEKSAMETALAQVEIVRGDFRNAIAGLNKLAESLKAAQREQKANGKEIESVRQTLRTLQNVRI